MSLFGPVQILLLVLALLLAAAAVRVHAEPEDYYDFRAGAHTRSRQELNLSNSRTHSSVKLGYTGGQKSSM